MSKRKFKPIDLKRLGGVLNPAAPGTTIESGRVGVPSAGEISRALGRLTRLPDLESLVDILSPSERAGALQRLREVRARATARDQIEAAEVAEIERKVLEAEKIEGVTRQIAEAQRARVQAAVEAAQQQQRAKRESGLEIVIGTEGPVHHSYRDKHGRACNTDKWFTACFLVYEKSKDLQERGGAGDPWFGLEGARFRCYYPASDAGDFRAILTSGSPGRWLHQWSQKSSYVRF